MTIVQFLYCFIAIPGAVLFWVVISLAFYRDYKRGQEYEKRMGEK